MAVDKWGPKVSSSFALCKLDLWVNTMQFHPSYVLVIARGAGVMLRRVCVCVCALKGLMVMHYNCYHCLAFIQSNFFKMPVIND